MGWNLPISAFRDSPDACPKGFPGARASSLLVHNLALAPRLRFPRPCFFRGTQVRALRCGSKPNPRINADAPRPFSATLGFTSLLSLVAISTLIRAQVMRNVVRLRG